MVLKGSDLRLNAYAPFGEIVVQLLDADGVLLKGFTSRAITADGLELPVSWTGDCDVKSLDGRPVQIKFRLTNARLYSYWCE